MEAGEQQELWCTVSRLAYPIDDGIPVLVQTKREH